MKKQFALILLSSILDVVIPSVGPEESLNRLTIPSKSTHPTCKKNDIFHSDIIEGHSLKRGLANKSHTILGKVPNMADCMALCCGTKNCNIAFMKNDTCYGVTCYDYDKCTVQNNTVIHPDSGVKLALILRNEMNRRVYVTAYMVVVVCAFGAAMSGTVWAVFVFYKRYTFLNINPTRKKENESVLEEGEEKKTQENYRMLD